MSHTMPNPTRADRPIDSGQTSSTGSKKRLVQRYAYYVTALAGACVKLSHAAATPRNKPEEERLRSSSWRTNRTKGGHKTNLIGRGVRAYLIHLIKREITGMIQKYGRALPEGNAPQA